MCVLVGSGTSLHHCADDPLKWLTKKVIPGADANLLHLVRLFGTHLSIGSTRNDLCSDIIKSRTVCTDKNGLDVVDTGDWWSLYGVLKVAPKNIFAEHVLEHLSPPQAQALIANAFLFLQPGGVFRVAVPDGYKPSNLYQQYVRPGSTPSGQGQNHMVSWTKDSLVPIFETVGFEIYHREHFEANGTFYTSADAYALDSQLGIVRRSFHHDSRNKHRMQGKAFNLVDDLLPDEPVYTSLWFDAVKPVHCESIVHARRGFHQ